MKNIIKSINWKDIGYRVAKTFIQALIGAVCAGDVSLTRKALIGAVTAAVCAAWNVAWGFLKPHIKKLLDEMSAENAV